VNVYSGEQRGAFPPHTDGHALTILVPLSPPSHFTGGGTGFWGPDARKPKAQPVPTVSLVPAAGSALCFSGEVMHAGLPVLTGERIVLVASFSARPMKTSAPAPDFRAAERHPATVADILAMNEEYDDRYRVKADALQVQLTGEKQRALRELDVEQELRLEVLMTEENERLSRAVVDLQREAASKDRKIRELERRLGG
jgi:hypothetical protein